MNKRCNTCLNVLIDKNACTTCDIDMRYSIDDAINTLINTNSYGMADIAKKVAINTMRKYQKIEEVIKSWKDGTLEEKDSVYAFHEIMGVVEDGNVD